MSTIKVDTYQTRGGASEIAIDKLKGVTAVATINVVAEGGTNTTSLQQGLAKVWADFNKETDNNIDNSLNTSSLTDTATGDTLIAYTTNMGNVSYSGCVDNSANAIGSSHHYGASFRSGSTGKPTNQARLINGYDPGNFTGNDSDHQSMVIHGDLA